MDDDAVEGYRLSPQQRRLVRLGAEQERVRLTFAVTGDVDVAALRNAAEQLVRRHESLRTRFIRPPEGALPLQVIDGAAAAVPGVEVSPADGRWQVTVEAPALCLDEGCADLLIADLTRAYAAALASSPSLEGQPLQYADVAAWFDDQLEAPSLENRQHWAERTPRFTVDVQGVGARATALTRQLTGAGRRLREAADACGVPADALLLAIWSVVAGEASPGSPSVLGVVRSGRRYSELEEVAGPVEAVAWIPADLADPSSSVSDLARRLAAELDAADKALECLPDDGRLPAVGFRWLPEPVVQHVAGVDITVQEARLFEFPFDVLLRARPRGDELDLEVRVLESRTAAPAGIVLAMTARLVDAVLARPLEPMTRHHLRSPEESRDVARRLNPRREPPGPQQLLVERVLAHAAASPDAAAMVCADGSLTYGELAARSGRVAGRLLSLGAHPEDVVAVAADLSRAWLVAVIGIWRAGCAYLAIDSTVPAARAALQLAHARVRLALVPQDRPGPAEDMTVIRLGPAGQIEHEPIASPLPPAGGLAVVTFTSGTTGTPKGVATEHGNIAAYAAAMSEVLDTGPAATLASPAGPAADLGGTAWAVALHDGATIAVLDPQDLLDASRFALAVRRFDVDVLKITPSHLDALLATAGAAVLPRSVLVLGGERLGADLVARVRSAAPALRVLNHYGPTETTIGALVHEVPPTEQAHGYVPIGRALASSVALPGGADAVPGVGRSAELWLAGRSVARGYLADPRSTAERFRPAPDGELPGGRAYITGDLIRLDGDGGAVFAGRVDDQIKIRGTRVEPAESEAALRSFPGVVSAVVLVTGPADGERLEAWFTATGGIRAEALAAHLRGLLPEAAVPARLHRLPAIPRTASGKTDRTALLSLRPAPSAAGHLPVGPLECAVARIFAELLECEVDDADASFFDLGGHSLLATRAIARLREDLGIDLSLEDFFAEPTVTAIAAAAGPQTLTRLHLLHEVDAMTDDEVVRALERFEAP